MKLRVMIPLFLFLFISGCALLPASATPTAENMHTKSDDSETTGLYNLIHDEERSRTVLFIDGETWTYNNYVDGQAVETVHDRLAEVIVTFRMEDGDWSLIYAPHQAESCNSYTWIPSEVLKPYDPAVMEAYLTYPVRVTPGTKLIDDVRGTEWTAEKWDYWLERRDGAYFIQMEGGISCPVNYEDILFPRVEGGKILWD